jgi:hypothetical protein
MPVLLAVTALLHVVLCLPGLHESELGTSAGPSAGHALSMSVPVQAVTAVCGKHAQLRSQKHPSPEDGDHHADCADTAITGTLPVVGTAPVLLGVLFSLMLTGVVLWGSGARTAVGNARGSPVLRHSFGYWVRCSMRGATLPGALGISRT